MNCWFRSKLPDGSWDPLTSKMLTFYDKGKQRAFYVNTGTGYKIPYSKGTSVQLRGENIYTTLFFRDNVKGNVWFN